MKIILCSQVGNIIPYILLCTVTSSQEWGGKWSQKKELYCRETWPTTLTKGSRSTSQWLFLSTLFPWHMRWNCHFASVNFLPNTHNLHLIMSKHQTNLSWWNFTKLLKCSRSSETQSLTSCDRQEEPKEAGQIVTWYLDGNLEWRKYRRQKSKEIAIKYGRWLITFYSSWIIPWNTHAITMCNVHNLRNWAKGTWELCALPL